MKTNKDDTIASGTSLHNRKNSKTISKASNDLLPTDRTQMDLIQDNVFKRRRGSSLVEESLHPRQNLQSEGFDVDAGNRPNSAVKNLAQQVEELKTEQQQQKDMLHMVLE